jgi:hypothetical protein
MARSRKTSVRAGKAASKVLRDDGGNWDLGYPRTVQRSDGKLVTVYYFNDARRKERHIAATIWDESESLSRYPVAPARTSST